MIKKYLLLIPFAAFLFSHTLVAQVVINEFSAANYSEVADNYGDYEDWIELYNSGAASVDLSGYYLSDDADEPMKWAIPSGITISAGGYLRFWCSKRDVVSGTNYHTNFKVTQTNDAEAIVFADASGVILDVNEIDEPNLMNHSWGRYPDGGADWKIFTAPTSNASNTTTPYSAYAAKPDMFPNSGNYAGSTDITITTTDPDITIYYTTDGALPTDASTTYSGTVPVSETKVLRTVAYSSNPDILPSFCSTNTYFIDEGTNMPIISIAGSVMSLEVTKSTKGSHSDIVP